MMASDVGTVPPFEVETVVNPDRICPIEIVHGARPTLLVHRDSSASSTSEFESDNDAKQVSSGSPLSAMAQVSFIQPQTYPQGSPVPQLRSYNFPSTTDVTARSTSMRPIFRFGKGNGSTSTGLSIRSWGSKPAIRKTVEAQRLALLGYEEELNRDHDLWSLLGLTVSNIGFLPGAFMGVEAAMSLGGSSMLAIGWPLIGIFMTAFSAVLAQLAGSYPVSGAMYTWTWKLCRSSPGMRGLSRFLSWICSAFLMTAHVLAQVILCFQFGKVLQGIVQVFRPDYDASLWHTAAIGALQLGFCLAVVCSPISRSPWVWRFSLIQIASAFTLLLVSILVTYHREMRSAAAIFTGYENTTGFTSAPYVYLVGVASTTIATGQDAAAHMAEETRNPLKTVPLAILWSVIITYGLGWIAICILLSCMTDDVLAASQTSHFPPATILTYKMGKPLATLILVMLLGTMVFQDVAQLTASSRFIWALARDSALPGSKVFRQVSSQKIPRFAACLVAVFVLPTLALVSIGSSVITGLALQGGGFAVMVAYTIPIACYAVAGNQVLDFDGRTQWTLRSLAMPLAWMSLAFGCFIMVIICFPSGFPVTAATLAWGPVIFPMVFIVSCVTWICYGNAHFAGPIKALLGPSVELPKASSIQLSTQGSIMDSSAIVGRTARVFLDSSFEPADSSADWATETGLNMTRIDYDQVRATGVAL